MLRCCDLQRGRRSDGRVHNAEYRAGADEVRRRRRHVSNRQHAAHTATVHGPVRGNQRVVEVVEHKTASPARAGRAVVFTRWNRCTYPSNTRYAAPPRPLQTATSIGPAAYAELTGMPSSRTDTREHRTRNKHLAMWRFFCGACDAA